VPPAASIFSRAEAETPCACTVRAFVSSPTPRTFTSIRIDRISRFAFSASGVTSAPASKRSSSALRLTGCVRVMNGPIGIASFDVEPRCLPTRM
jgi:hypothetical protein